MPRRCRLRLPPRQAPSLPPPLLLAQKPRSRSALRVARCAQARYLKFCQDYNLEACCIPGHDLENQVQFENLIAGLGPGCKNPMMYPEVRYFYCLGCDPKQPQYTNNTSPGPDLDGTISICKSFLTKMWSDPTFDECGVMKSNACPTSWDNDNMDPYMCGDDLELPKSTYANPLAFINAYKPPGLDGFEFAEYDDTGVDNPPCWDPPAFRSAGVLRGAGSSVLAAALAIAAAAVLTR